MVMIYCVAIMVIFALFLLYINMDFRFAYKLYKIPKIHYIVDKLCFRNRQYLKSSVLLIPHMVMCAIDDMGWMSGMDLRDTGGPSRLMTKKNPTLEDYQEVVKIARESGTRLLGLFVLSEMDMQDVCAKEEYNLPVNKSNLTELGVKWRNRANIEDAKLIMQYVYDNSAYLEFGLHGVRHEYFDEQGMKNAEWADGNTGKSWGTENTKAHCDAFREILRQYYTESQCSFPECFVPTSHAFSLYSDDAKILHSYGIKYMCSSCATRPTMKSLRYNGTFRDGILMLDRTELNGAEKMGNVPRVIPINAWVGTHFPNYWGKKGKKWVRYLKKINQNYDTMLGRNAKENYSQWLYNHYLSYQVTLKEIKINNLYMPLWVYAEEFLYGIWLKIHLHRDNHLSKIDVPGLSMAAYYEDENDNAYIYMLNNSNKNGALETQEYAGNYMIGKKLPNATYIDACNETFNICHLCDDGHIISLLLLIYGAHEVRIKTQNNIKSINCVEGNVENLVYECNQITFSVNAINMIGEVKNIKLYYES